MTIHYNICIFAFIDISIYHSDLSFNHRLTNKDLQRKLYVSFADNTDTIYRQNDTRLHSMFYQRQLQPVVTLPTPTTDNFYEQSIQHYQQYTANGSSANNDVCNQPEVDVLLFITSNHEFEF